MEVRDVGPPRVVVVGLAGHRHAVLRAQHAQGVFPPGGQDALAVGEQQVQPRIGVPLTEVSDKLPDALGPELERVRRQLRRVAHRLGRRVRPEHGPVDHAVVREQPPAGPEGRGGGLVGGHAGRGRADRGQDAARGDHRRHRGERRVAPQWPARAPASRLGPAAGVEPRPPAVRVHRAVLLPARGVGLAEQAVLGFQQQLAQRARGAEPGQVPAHLRRSRPAARR